MITGEFVVAVCIAIAGVLAISNTAANSKLSTFVVINPRRVVML